VVRPGQEHDLKSFEVAVLSATRAGTPRRLAADKAYSARFVRTWLQRRHIAPVIPTRSNQEPDPRFDRRRYRSRNIIERLVGWLKESRRIATRYEKLATSYLAFVKLAMIRRLVASFPDRA
jgi:transposase